MIYMILFPIIAILIFNLAGYLLLKFGKKATTSESDRLENKKNLKSFVRSSGLLLVGSLSIHFGYIKTISENVNTKINIYEDNKSLTITGDGCDYKINNNQKTEYLSMFIPEKLIYQRADIIKSANCKDYNLFKDAIANQVDDNKLPSYARFLLLDKIIRERNSEIVLLDKTVRRGIADSGEYNFIENSEQVAGEKNIEYEDFIYSIAFYSLMSLSFFLAVVKFWYESSSSLYRHFNDQFVDTMLKFNKENNIDLKKAYAERLFQLLKEEYLIFYKQNFVYGVVKLKNESKKTEEEIDFSLWNLNFKYWKNNFSYVLGTSQYLDEWFTMMRNLSILIKEEKNSNKDIVENRMYRGDNELETYFVFLYLDRLDKLKKITGATYDPSGFLHFIENAVPTEI